MFFASTLVLCCSMGKKKNKSRLQIGEFNRSVSAPSERISRAISRYGG